MYRCYNPNCPHFSEPCELSDMDYDMEWQKRSTPCPLGERDWFAHYNPDEEFMLLVVGSRSFNDYDFLKAKLDFLLQKKVQQGKKIVVLSGGADGADTLAEKYAKERKYPMLIMHADWESDGKAAGYIRNKKMHTFLAKHSDRGCVAFWDGKSKGTTHNFDLAKQNNTHIKIVRV